MESDSKEKTILGGFYTYRAIPDPRESASISTLSSISNSKNDFRQKGEITGICVIKKSESLNDAIIFTYKSIDMKNPDPTNRFIRHFIKTEKDEMPNDKDEIYFYDRFKEILDKTFIQGAFTI